MPAYSGSVDLTVHLEAGERIRTQASSKFIRRGLAAQLVRAAFIIEGWYTDDKGRFGVAFVRPIEHAVVRSEDPIPPIDPIELPGFGPGQ